MNLIFKSIHRKMNNFYDLMWWVIYYSNISFEWVILWISTNYYSAYTLIARIKQATTIICIRQWNLYYTIFLTHANHDGGQNHSPKMVCTIFQSSLSTADWVSLFQGQLSRLLNLKKYNCKFKHVVCVQQVTKTPIRMLINTGYLSK